ncbi:MAG: hypothetical protein HYU98_07940 [Deltaproteobacteria bacterium]|nr:hypothetical protein [Deltaproteobacteria bacterium]
MKLLKKSSLRRQGSSEYHEIPPPIRHGGCGAFAGMTQRKWCFFIGFIIFLPLSSGLTLFSSAAIAKSEKSAGSISLPEGDNLFASGQFENAAKWYLNYFNTNASNKEAAPAALIKLGQSLERMSDIINTGAEKECFRFPKKLRGTPCMNEYVGRLNAFYGSNSFEYLEQMVFISYTGSHYQKAASEYPDSKSAPEAAYMYLTKKIKGHPDEVLPRIKEYTSKYKDGAWHRKGLLLWARVNEDVWWIHRKWSWVLYNGQVEPEELIIKAEPYRQEGLRAFQELIQKDSNTEEGKIAKKEYELLKSYQDDGKLYGIINEADVEGTKAVPGHELVQ